MSCRAADSRSEAADAGGSALRARRSGVLASGAPARQARSASWGVAPKFHPRRTQTRSVIARPVGIDAQAVPADPALRTGAGGNERLAVRARHSGFVPRRANADRRAIVAQPNHRRGEQVYQRLAPITIKGAQ